eukprot:7399197-Pyramimonas_sp.AAC.1
MAAPLRPRGRADAPGAWLPPRVHPCPCPCPGAPPGARPSPRRRLPSCSALLAPAFWAPPQARPSP